MSISNIEDKKTIINNWKIFSRNNHVTDLNIFILGFLRKKDNGFIEFKKEVSKHFANEKSLKNTAAKVLHCIYLYNSGLNFFYSSDSASCFFKPLYRIFSPFKYEPSKIECRQLNDWCVKLIYGEKDTQYF